MSAEMAGCSAIDSRESERLALNGSVQYRYGPGEYGYAQWQDIGRGGASLNLGRYLRPGRPLTIVRRVRSLHDEPIEIAARIAWCRPCKDGKNFLAGIRFRRQTPEICFAISSLVREAHKARLCYLAEQLRLDSLYQLED